MAAAEDSAGASSRTARAVRTRSCSIAQTASFKPTSEALTRLDATGLVDQPGVELERVELLVDGGDPLPHRASEVHDLVQQRGVSDEGSHPGRTPQLPVDRHDANGDLGQDGRGVDGRVDGVEIAQGHGQRADDLGRGRGLAIGRTTDDGDDPAHEQHSVGRRSSAPLGSEEPKDPVLRARRGRSWAR